ncbi:MAG TPA: threonine/serine exporter family protein [Opitutaceae bacterium]|nr:threonine/serine exporter family protein [Opitutaceae bacterium]
MSLPNPPEPMDIAPLCAETALRLLQHGAESALVESLARRLGLALGAERVEVALMANAVTVAVRIRGRSMTTVRRNEDRGINMHVVMEVQRLVLDVEAGKLDRLGYRERFLAIQPLHHPRWLVAVVVGVSCACFAALNHADLAACILVTVASTVAMAVRQQLAQLHFSPMIVFGVTAFVATSLTVLGYWHNLSTTPKAAMAASVLLLVPGYPLINSVSDMVKGYVNTGISRGVFALLLSAATCAGILTAMAVWRIWGWLS